MRIAKSIEVDFPEWALSYFVNGDAGGLDAFDIKTVDKWWTSMKDEGYTDVDFTDDRNEFCRYPEFGLACSTVRANVIRLV